MRVILNSMAIQQTSPSYGDSWRKYDSIERRLSAPLSERMLDLGKLRPGMRVLDLATGRGEPAIPAARRVHPNGAVLGIDIDHSVLQLARERADREGVSNLALAVSDIESLDGVPVGSFDVAFARWSLMYLRRPILALQAVRRTLAANGVLVVAVWIDPDRSSFFEFPRAALSKISPIPATDHDLPGPFYYADAMRLHQDMERSGFNIQHSEVFEVDVMEAKSGADLIAWARTFGMSRLLKDVPPDIQKSWEGELMIGAESFRRSDGLIRLGGTSRIVVAT